jgi:hypothetical protein
VRLRRGIKARGNCLAGHHEVRGRAAQGSQRGRKKTAGVDRCSVEDTSNRWGPVDRETRERRPAREGVNRKGKCISQEDVTDARAGWVGQAILACGDGAAGGLAGLEAKWAAGSTGPKIRKKEISELKLNF